MKFRKVLPHVVFAILVGVFVFLNNSGENRINKSQTDNIEVLAEKTIAQVLRVIDGDTIEVGLNNKKETVRLIGIDAPETVDPRKPVQCFGIEASNKAKEVLNSKTITLERDPMQGERDKYGRLLRYVFLNDLNFNKLMISEGFAHEFTYEDNSYKYMDEFKSAEREAGNNKKGLWSDVVKCNYE